MKSVMIPEGKLCFDLGVFLGCFHTSCGEILETVDGSLHSWLRKVLQQLFKEPKNVVKPLLLHFLTIKIGLDSKEPN